MSQDLVRERPDQQEQLAHIGAHLQDVRKQHNRSLEQVSAETLIQTRLLRAIEAGDLNTLPEAIYIRGFIKRYADSLGLNGSEIAATFPADADVQPTQISWNNSAAAQLRPLHLYAAYVVLIVAAVSGVSYLLSVMTPRTLTTLQQSPPASQPSEEAASDRATSSATASDVSGAAAEQPVPGGSATSANGGALPASEPSDDSPVQVSLELVERSWLRVIVDGNEEFEGVLQEGSEQTWTADSEVIIRAGNAGGVLLAINNSPAELMGAPGAVSEQTFSIDSSAEDEQASVP
ncbi:MAG: helix-turn-helix domain-containing protein [Elainellaceae cyanobacterium]